MGGGIHVESLTYQINKIYANLKESVESIARTAVRNYIDRRRNSHKASDSDCDQVRLIQRRELCAAFGGENDRFQGLRLVHKCDIWRGKYDSCLKLPEGPSGKRRYSSLLFLSATFNEPK